MSDGDKELVKIAENALRSEGSELHFCKVIRGSDKGLGFVIYDVDAPRNRYYLHIGKEEVELTLGDTILCLVAASTRCENRIDVKEFIQFNNVSDFVGSWVSELELQDLLGLFKFEWIKLFVIQNYFSELFELVGKERLSIDELVGHIGHYSFLKRLKKLRKKRGLTNVIGGWEVGTIISFLSLPSVEASLTEDDCHCVWQRMIQGEISLNKVFEVVSDECKECLIKCLPVNYFAKIWRVTSFGEDQFCRYILEYMSEDFIENQEDISVHIARQDMMQARLLLALWRAKESTDYDKFTPLDWLKKITILFDSSFLKLMFEAHAADRKPIDNIVWHACTVTDHWRRPLTVCEGKKIESQRDDGSVTMTMCRNNACALPGYVGNQPIFYQALDKWFCIDYNTLHANEEFTRSLAAVNRWNEVLPRLYCRCCDDPLEYSEHNKNSMGNMAYGVSYWHCSNELCDENNESIKITHCIGCGKIIDSRDDKQACNPEELRAESKVYICTTCASCCKRVHGGWSGVCPSCGERNAYSGEKNRQFQLVCQYCNHPVKPPAKFKRIVVQRIKAGSERRIEVLD